MNTLVAFAVTVLSLAVLGEPASCPGQGACTGSMRSTHEPMERDVDHDAEFARLLGLVHQRHEDGSLIIARERWPRGLPMRINFNFAHQTFLALTDDYQIEFVDCQLNVLKTYRIPRRHTIIDPPSPGVWRDPTIAIPTTCIDNVGNVDFAVRVRSASDGDVVSDPMTLSFNVALVDAVDDAIAAVIDEDVRMRLADKTSVYVYRSTGTRYDEARIAIYIPRALLLDMTMAWRIELIREHDDNVVGTAYYVTTERLRRIQRRLLATGGDMTIIRLDLDTEFPPEDLMEQVQRHPVRAHITSSPEIALRDFESSRYWHGSFTTDVEVVAWDD